MNAKFRSIHTRKTNPPLLRRNLHGDLLALGRKMEMWINEGKEGEGIAYLNSNHSLLETGLGKNCLGQLYLNLGKAEEAKTLLMEAVELSKQENDSGRGAASLCLLGQLFAIYYEDEPGSSKKAQAYFAEARALDPTYIPAYYNPQCKEARNGDEKQFIAYFRAMERMCQDRLGTPWWELDYLVERYANDPELNKARSFSFWKENIQPHLD